MSEVEKMRNGQLADMSVPEMQVRFEKAKKLLARMRGLSTYDEEYRPLLEEQVRINNANWRYPVLPAEFWRFPELRPAASERAAY